MCVCVFLFALTFDPGLRTPVFHLILDSSPVLSASHDSLASSAATLLISAHAALLILK